MPLSCQTERRTLTARVSGEIDHHAARHLMRELDRAIESRSPLTLVLDLGGVSFMDSSGIAVVINALRCMKQIDGRLELSGIQAQPMRVFQASGVDKIIQIQEVNV
jgi:stage II sporulation protein AA (anti-sigma F factor antagonist)